MNIPPKAVKATVAERLKAARIEPLPPARRRRRRLVAAALCMAAAGALAWWQFTRETAVGNGRNQGDRAVPKRFAQPANGAPAWQASGPAAPSLTATPGDGSAMLRAIAEQALRYRFPDVDLSEFKPGYLVYMENPSDTPVPFAFVDWIGKDALAVEKGETPDRDRKQVRKLRVKLTANGELVDVQDTRVWLYRSAAASP